MSQISWMYSLCYKTLQSKLMLMTALSVSGAYLEEAEPPPPQLGKHTIACVWSVSARGILGTLTRPDPTGRAQNAPSDPPSPYSQCKLWQQTNIYTESWFNVRSGSGYPEYLTWYKMLGYRRETALQGALYFWPKVEDWNWETIFYD